MDIYKKFQPVTWYIGVIEAEAEDIIRNIQPLYIPDKELEGIYQEKKPIEESLASLEPIGGPTKFLLFETVDRRTVLFNTIISFVELPTSYAMDQLGVSSYYICNVPNTISKDQRSGAWGARKLEYRVPGNTIVQEPTFGIHLINDCGRWCFYRNGEKQPFEDENAYKAWRKRDRFTEKMLIEYCQALGIPVYDSEFYTDNCIIIEGKSHANEKGYSYEEAAIKLRISRDI